MLGFNSSYGPGSQGEETGTAPKEGICCLRGEISAASCSMGEALALGGPSPTFPQPPKGKISERAGEENGVACGERSTKYKRECQGAAVGAALVRD